MNALTRYAPLALALFALGSLPMIESCSSTQPAETQLSDAGITSKVKSKLIADPEVSAHNIDVDTEEGTVYLTGRVKTQKQKDEAERLARDTEGVVKVVNHLNVGEIKENK